MDLDIWKIYVHILNYMMPFRFTKLVWLLPSLSRIQSAMVKGLLLLLAVREAFNKKKHFLIDIRQKAGGGVWSELRQ